MLLAVSSLVHIFLWKVFLCTSLWNQCAQATDGFVPSRTIVIRFTNSWNHLCKVFLRRCCWRWRTPSSRTGSLLRRCLFPTPTLHSSPLGGFRLTTLIRDAAVEIVGKSCRYALHQKQFFGCSVARFSLSFYPIIIMLKFVQCECMRLEKSIPVTHSVARRRASEQRMQGELWDSLSPLFQWSPRP